MSDRKRVIFLTIQLVAVIAIMLMRSDRSHAQVPKTIDDQTGGSAEQLLITRGEETLRFASAVTSTSKPLIGLAANPPANEPYTTANAQVRFDQSIAAGVTYLYFAPKWDELEPSPGQYDFRDLDWHLSLARSGRIPLCLNLRVIDTNQRAMPADLSVLSFTDQIVIERLTALIAALVPRLEDDVTWVMVGNEVDAYFVTHEDEVQSYRILFYLAATKFKELVPGVQTSITITFDGLAFAEGFLKPLLDSCDFLSLTYYPLKPDMTFRDPSVVTAEFAQIVTAAKGKKTLLQEVGYSSSTLNNSSQTKQANFVKNVLTTLKARQGDFLGANFFLRSDMSDSLVDQFALYYSLPNAAQFKSFLKTLGMFDDMGRYKKSWDMFRRYAKLE